MNLYAEHILDHYKNPRNVGEVDGGISASETNPLCGDEITVSVILQSREAIHGVKNLDPSISSQDDVVAAIKHQTRGCSITIASASILSEYLVGKNIEEITKLTEDDIKSILNIDLTPARIKCAMLPLWAVKKALEE